MAKGPRSVYFCQNCGHESAKWMGQCPACKSWNSFVEEKITPVRSGGGKGQRRDQAERKEVLRISEIELESASRVTTSIGELDRVLGGGIVPGSLLLIGGDPGIGKSTLLLQTCRNLAASGSRVLYVSGEESAWQIRMRAERIGKTGDGLLLFTETDLSEIRNAIEREKPEICVIDSIQTMYSPEVSSAPGSVSQVREATAVLLQMAKTMNISIFIVGHVTKDGSVAGPRVLEHMVDTVLYFEGDRHASYRILRAVKNRFGSTDEIGVFEMRTEGLAEVPDPSAFMLSGRPGGISGAVVSCSMEGSRPVLIEIQALVARSSFGLPRRTAAGTDANRVNLLIAVLERRCGIKLTDHDAYVNIAGGIRMTEPAVDLGIALALASGVRDIPISENLMVFGEIGLGGEIRAVSQAEQRVMEAKKLGFDTVIMPKSNVSSAIEKIKGMTIHPVSTLREAVSKALG